MALGCGASSRHLIAPPLPHHPHCLGNRKTMTVPCSECKAQLKFDAETREVEVVEAAAAAAK